MNNIQQLWRYVSIIHRCSQKYLGRALSKFGIKASEYPFFILLSKQNNLSQHDLSELSGVDEAQTVRVMKGLEQKGWITRERSKTDRRVILISLTEEGKKLQPLIDKALDQWHISVTNDLHSREIHNLYSLMAEISSRSWELVNRDECEKEE